VKKFGRSALNVGLSRTEVIEAVIQTAPFSGFAPALNALAALTDALS
jgi:alkylhydroperoxidase/carboxymuconolactone decarboxylase family protein YurZ